MVFTTLIKQGSKYGRIWDSNLRPEDPGAAKGCNPVHKSPGPHMTLMNKAHRTFFTIPRVESDKASCHPREDVQGSKQSKCIHVTYGM